MINYKNMHRTIIDTITLPDGLKWRPETESVTSRYIAPSAHTILNCILSKNTTDVLHINYTNNYARLIIFKRRKIEPGEPIPSSFDPTITTHTTRHHYSDPNFITNFKKTITEGIETSHYFLAAELDPNFKQRETEWD